jgi:transposase
MCAYRPDYFRVSALENPLEIVFTAEAPAGVSEEKYDATSASMMALRKYGSGMPFHRLEGQQEKLEIPLPASTQWGILKETAERLEPVLEELIRQGGGGRSGL